MTVQTTSHRTGGGYLTRPAAQAYRAIVGDALPTIPEVARQPEAMRAVPGLQHLAGIELVARPANQLGATYLTVSTALCQGVHHILTGHDATEVLPQVEQHIQHLLRQHACAE